MVRRKKYQSILEYTVILAAIIAAVIVGAKVIGGKMQTNFNSAGNVIDSASTDFSNAYTPENATQ